MELFFGIDTLNLLIVAMLIGFVAGVIKGVVGFGMPTVLISGLGAITSAEVALAGLILPTLMTNGWQALRQGIGAAWASVRRFRVFLAITLIVMLFSAQLVPIIPESAYLLFIGCSVTFFVGLQLLGRTLPVPQKSDAGRQSIFGTITGFFGGLSGIWGPPTVAMLTAMNIEKSESIRVQGVVYGLGSFALVAGHLKSGVLRADTLPLSVALIPTALIGIWVGFQIHDRIDQATFRKATLVVLLLAGLNLIRRGLV